MFTRGICSAAEPQPKAEKIQMISDFKITDSKHFARDEENHSVEKYFAVLLRCNFFSRREDFRLVFECSSQTLRALCGQKPSTRRPQSLRELCVESLPGTEVAAAVGWVAAEPRCRKPER